MKTVVSVFDHFPRHIGGVERMARQLSVSLAEVGYRAVLAFSAEPPPDVREFLETPGVILDTPPAGVRLPRCTAGSVRRLLRQYSPEILHLHFGSVMTSVPWLGKLHGARTYMTVHDSVPEGFAPLPIAEWKRLVARLILYPVEGVFAVSEFSAQYVRGKAWFPPERVYSHPNAVELPDLAAKLVRRDRWRSLWNVPEDALLLSTVSNMIPEKGLVPLIQAFPAILSQFPNARLALVGDGRSLPDFRQCADSLGIGLKVTFTGHDPDPSGSGAFDAADVFCAPSTWQEAFGFSIAEALSHAVPVVASRVGGIPELVLDEVTGLLVKPGSPAEISAAVASLFASPALRIRLAYAGRRHMEYNFDLATSCQALLRHYGVALAAQSRAVSAATIFG